MNHRKFYRTVIEVEILSEDPYDAQNLNQIAHDITYGDCSGSIVIKNSEIINGKKVAELLVAQGSDPAFFGLTEDGYEEDFPY